MRFKALSFLLLTLLVTLIQHAESSKSITLTRLPLITVQENTLHHEEECYPWMFRSPKSGKCECSEIPYRSVLCDPTIPRTSILDCFCMTYNPTTNETELGRCLYGCGHPVDTVLYPLPNNTNALNDYTCGKYNRDLTLCAKCLPGFSPLVYSYDANCINCTGVYMPYNWIKYVAIAYVPLTVFFILAVAFNFNGNFPLLKYFISICQAMVSPIATRAFLITVSEKVFVNWAVRIITCIYGIWNLDFFRTVIPPICVDITPLQVLALDYAIAIYPLLLIVVTCILISLHNRDIRIVVFLWRPFHKLFSRFKKDWDLGGSIANAFATFFLLSYLKILNTTTDLLVFTEKFVLGPNSRDYVIKYVLYYDSSVEYFGKEHLPYGILAIFVGIFVVIFPIVFLVVYPRRWLQMCLNVLKIRHQNLDLFVNCFQGYYKDGTNGTRDLRWFSALFFILQVLVFVAFTLTRSMYCCIIGTSVAVIAMYLQLSLQPYKEQFKAYNYVDGFMLLLLVTTFILIVAGDEADIKASNFSTLTYIVLACISHVPLIYLIVISVWWLLVKKNIRKWCSCSCLQRKQDTVNENPTNEMIEEYDFPHRLEHPAHYSPCATLVSPKQGENPCKYGTL